MYVRPLECDFCTGYIQHEEVFYTTPDGERICAGCYSRTSKDDWFKSAGGRICCHEEDHQ